MYLDELRDIAYLLETGKVTHAKLCLQALIIVAEAQG